MDDGRYIFTKPLDDYLERLTEQRKLDYVQHYAVDEHGKVDPALVYRINREVHRRAAMSRELDIYEPLRWTGMSFLLSVAVGAGIKATTEKSFSKPALITLTATTALTSAIQLVRLIPRYDAALKGGVDTALAMHEFDVSVHGREAVNALVQDSGDDPWVKRVADSQQPEGPKQGK